jgi:hypothetical protein
MKQHLSQSNNIKRVLQSTYALGSQHAGTVQSMDVEGCSLSTASTGRVKTESCPDIVGRVQENVYENSGQSREASGVESASASSASAVGGRKGKASSLASQKKTCRVCKVERKIKMFSRHKSYKDGYRTICKICDKKRKKIWDQKNWEKVMVQSSKLADKRASKKYPKRAIDPELKYISTEHIKWLMEAQYGDCVHCWKPLEYGEGVNRIKNPRGASIERIDNEYSHYEFNCVLSCGQCNSMRGKNIPFEVMQDNALHFQEGLRKWCPACEKVKFPGDFTTNGTRCKPCMTIYNTKIRKIKDLRQQHIEESQALIDECGEKEFLQAYLDMEE